MAFKWKLQGVPNMEILTRLEARGLKISKQTLHIVLTNPFYAGKIVHKSLKGEMVDGKIEQAVSYPDFLKVQKILSSRTGKYHHAKQKPNFPLTKHVCCYSDGTAFTSYVKTKNNRTGKHEYGYYKCNRSGCKTNVSATEMHKKYETVLGRYDLSKEILSQFESVVTDMIEQYNTEAISQTRILKKRLTEINNDMDAAHMRYATGKVEEESFTVALKKLNEEKDVILLELEKWDADLSNSRNEVQEVIATASNIGGLWHEADLGTKKQIQNLVFPQGVYWDKEIGDYRTVYKNKIFDVLDKFSVTYGNEKRQPQKEVVALWEQLDSNQ